MSRYRDFEYTDAARMTVSPAAGNVGGLTSQFAVPALQSVFSGLAAGLLAGALCWSLWNPGTAVLVGLLAGVIVFAVSWAVLLDDSRSLLRIRQTSFQQQPLQAELQPRERVVLVNPPRAEPAENVRKTRFAQFVRACAVDTSLRRLEALGFTRDEVTEFREALMRLRAARWKGRGQSQRQGWALIESPDSILERLS